MLVSKYIGAVLLYIIILSLLLMPSMRNCSHLVSLSISVLDEYFVPSTIVSAWVWSCSASSFSCEQLSEMTSSYNSCLMQERYHIVITTNESELGPMPLVSFGSILKIIFSKLLSSIPGHILARGKKDNPGKPNLSSFRRMWLVIELIIPLP